MGCFGQLKAKLSSKKASSTLQAYATSSSPALPLGKGVASSQPLSSTPPSEANAATAPLVKASSTPNTSTTPNATASASSPPERLWNQAYDLARSEDSKTVDAYEIVLSVRCSQEDADLLDPSHPGSTDNTTPKNEIEQDAKKRGKQMCQLVQSGLQDIEKEANKKKLIESGIQVVMTFKELVDKAVQASPQAALAWVGVCLGLEILMNPLTQASLNRQGIAYVVSRMEWYWKLWSLLLDENIQPHQQDLRGELEKSITQLYAQLLLYQMRSVCSYYRGRFSVFVRDLVKLDDWDGKLSGIKDAEATVQEDSLQYSTQSIRTQLGDIAETAKSQDTKLDNIISAIHEQTKQQKAMHETDEDKKCLRGLHVTDPRDDKKRIEDLKGGLLKDSYKWILENSQFQKWHYEDDPQSRLLWVKADPGKGKTMLLCGIIDELQGLNTPDLLAYFFCQATDSRINSATAVLRGLLYLLVEQQPSLISHVREKYDRAGQALFKDANAWVALSGIFTDILRDAELENTYLIIDALDECTTDLSKLLDFIAQNSSVSSRVKWIISSRNWPDIEERLEHASHQVRLSLELNEESVSAAVSTFIKHKVSELVQLKDYNESTRDFVLKYLASNANDTFLWVALVCQNLSEVPRRNVKKALSAFPPGLDSLYKRMIVQISNSDDTGVCKQILASVAIVYRPLTMRELATFVEQSEDTADDQESVQEMISSCGSFLTVREGTIYFVHQSAKDFLFRKATDKASDKASDEASKVFNRKFNKVFAKFFPSGWEDATHYAIFARSLDTISGTLSRDVYKLKELGYPAEQVRQPDPDPLAASRYTCFYWIDHLNDSHPDLLSKHAISLQDEGSVHNFLRQKYLYWLECLSLCKGMSKGVDSMAKLEMLVQKSSNAVELSKLVQDARRFIMSHKGAIEHSPLQAYASALLFSPAGSLVRNLFKREEPKWATIKPAVGDAWSACLQTLEGHSGRVLSVAFSRDSTRLASASDDNTVKIWDASSGECLQTLGIGRSVENISFDTTGSYLYTQIGTIAITASAFFQTADVTGPQHPQFQGGGISPDRAWITYNDKHILWLPSEYRPSCSAVSENKVGIGVGSGKLWICSLLPGLFSGA